MTVVLVAFCGACGADAAGPDRQLRQTIAEEKIAIEHYLRIAEETLPNVPADIKPALEAAVTRARAALKRYATVARRGNNRRSVEGTLYVTGVALTLDDASGAGILDNVLLPFVALGFVATRLTMDAPAGSQEITQAWNEVVDAFADTGQVAGSEVLQAVGRIPPMDKCTEHYALCLMTPLGRRNSGGLWKHSICKDCFNMCRPVKQWPPTTGDGKSCHWWTYVKGLEP